MAVPLWERSTTKGQVKTYYFPGLLYLESVQFAVMQMIRSFPGKKQVKARADENSIGSISNNQPLANNPRTETARDQ